MNTGIFFSLLLVVKKYLARPHLHLSVQFAVFQDTPRDSWEGTEGSCDFGCTASLPCLVPPLLGGSGDGGKASGCLRERAAQLGALELALLSSLTRGAPASMWASEELGACSCCSILQGSLAAFHSLEKIVAYDFLEWFLSIPSCWGWRGSQLAVICIRINHWYFLLVKVECLSSRV